MNHDEFENGLMNMLLAGEDNILLGLRGQYDKCTVKARRFTGVGFYTDFKVNRVHEPVAGGKSFYIGDVDGAVDGNKGTLGFVLFIKDGFISSLEGYANLLDVWPEEYSNIELTYDTGANRDITSLSVKWK